MGEFNIQKYIITRKLIQETPLIHFQYRKPGATLRASEVKPKLDRFIIKNCDGADKLIKSHPNWIDKDNESLRYKMHISADNSISKPIDKKLYDIIYANTGKDKYGFIIGSCDMTIVCYDRQLRDVIEKYLNDFFIANSFGLMSGKGFGGYLPAGFNPTDDEIGKALKNAYGCKKFYRIDKNKNDKTNENKNDKSFIFSKMVKPFHSLLKSGINIKDKYSKSYLFKYFHKKYNYGNEKAFIKLKKIAPSLYRDDNHKHTESHYHQYKYVRALLGLCGKFEYIKSLDAGKEKIKVNVKAVTEDNKESEAVRRFASPVKYRIIGDKVYVFAVPVDKRIFGAKFNFSSSYVNNNKSHYIYVPDESEFDIEDFLSEFIKFMKGEDDESKSARCAGGFYADQFEEVTING